MNPFKRSGRHPEIPNQPGSPVDSRSLTTARPDANAQSPSGFTGSTVIAQIVVGAPSPSVEPIPTATAYRSLSFRPDVALDGWSTDSVTVRGVSLRGHLHRYNGAPRQDDFAVHHLPDGRVIVAVADGVSESPQSHLGSSIAVTQAVDWIRTNLGPNTADLDWTALIKNTAYALAARAQTLFGLDEPDPVRAEQEMATTLVCAVIEPVKPGLLGAHLVAVGDSSAWVLTAGEFNEVLSGKATVSEGGIASSAVSALPRVPTQITPTVIEFLGDAILLIGTDGIGDPLGSGEGSVGDLFRNVLARPSPPSLIEFAHAVDFSRETFDDDRTLVAVWPRWIDSWRTT
jgi:serine/threonine protein phosphatase PrpC